MIRRPPRSTLSSSSAASDVYKRQIQGGAAGMSSPAIVLLAHSRPQYFERAIKAIAALPEVAKFTFYVSFDHSSQQAAMVSRVAALQKTHPAIADVWKMPPAETSPHARTGTLSKISQHFKMVMDKAFVEMRHSHLIMLEEDLLPSNDFLEYFEAAAAVMEKDPTLWCASAFNDNGMKGIATDHERLFRTNYFPGLGWMLRAELWISELRALWPLHPSTGWDHWLRLSSTHKGRECIVPEVPRTQHIGREGANVHEVAGSSMEDRYAFATVPGVRFDQAEGLVLSTYDANLQATIRRAERRTVSSLTNMSPEKIYVIPYLTEDFGRIKAAFGLWPDNPRAYHAGVIFLRDRRSSALVLLADRRECEMLEKSEQLRPNPQAKTLPAEINESCAQACQRHKMRCEEAELVFMNSCRVLMRHFRCEAGCGHQVGPDIPNYVTNRAEPTFQQCLISDGGTKCGAAHPSTQRLCACVP
eukprot:TRINITY_DN61459_c0_g1_i1.p1 TRINITY_DN61459_c0_g1~~TRINITY_DN61459_c0_g1_i1.p1  ORF type:complete len:473 (+),score=96.51 TRINITY_DN61459_c0_g1_i1:147-1565(+)